MIFISPPKKKNIQNQQIRERKNNAFKSWQLYICLAGTKVCRVLNQFQRFLKVVFFFFIFYWNNKKAPQKRHQTIKKVVQEFIVYLNFDWNSNKKNLYIKKSIEKVVSSIVKKKTHTQKKNKRNWNCLPRQLVADVIAKLIHSCIFQLRRHRISSNFEMKTKRNKTKKKNCIRANIKVGEKKKQQQHDFVLCQQLTYYTHQPVFISK